MIVKYNDNKKGSMIFNISSDQGRGSDVRHVDVCELRVDIRVLSKSETLRMLVWRRNMG